jgi:GDP-L-fucose synthase
MADACVFLMERQVGDGIFNVGCGNDITIRELAETVMDVVSFTGNIIFDSSRPDGTPRKLLDVSRMTGLGWQAKTSLRKGIAETYASYRESLEG